MPGLTCDVLVVGAGPAGAFAALILARAGADVVLVSAGDRRLPGPGELLAPAARRLLDSHGLVATDIGAVPCEGVLSRLGEGGPEFHDYALLACAPALSLDRSRFDAKLVASAREAGVRILESARVRGSRRDEGSGGHVELSVGGRRLGVSSGWVLEATGRKGPYLRSRVDRRRFDRLVALATPFAPAKCRNFLVVEAARDGWWYAAPATQGAHQLVFLTDADLLPRGGAARREWLATQFHGTELVAGSVAEDPDFSALQGYDAGFSIAQSPAVDGWAAIGDAALALDPLSGHGIWTALRGAGRAARALIDRGRIDGDYCRWVADRCEEEVAMRTGTYAAGRLRFRNSPFWARRSAGLRFPFHSPAAPGQCAAP